MADRATAARRKRRRILDFRKRRVGIRIMTCPAWRLA
jgi:hypothetical protein